MRHHYWAYPAAAVAIAVSAGTNAFAHGTETCPLGPSSYVISQTIDDDAGKCDPPGPMTDGNWHVIANWEYDAHYQSHGAECHPHLDELLDYWEDYICVPA